MFIITRASTKKMYIGSRKTVSPSFKLRWAKTEVSSLQTKKTKKITTRFITIYKNNVKDLVLLCPTLMDNKIPYTFKLVITYIATELQATMNRIIVLQQCITTRKWAFTVGMVTPALNPGWQSSGFLFFFWHI